MGTHEQIDRPEQVNVKRKEHAKMEHMRNIKM
jgi:hypothetical protein